MSVAKTQAELWHSRHPLMCGPLYRSDWRAACGPPDFFCGPWAINIPFPTHIYLGKIWLFKPKYDIFDDHFRNLLRFSQICTEIFKIIMYPLPPRYLSHVWNELAAPRTFKITENGPWLKKSGHPCYI
jgi:hypothetical protein